MHIGSQITDLAPFDNAFALLAGLRPRIAPPTGMGSTMSISAAASASPIPSGEDPESYHPDRYAEIVRRHIKPLGCKLVFEPGRLIVGNAGVLVTKVIYVKRGAGQEFRHRRRGDERSDAADALRGASRHFPGD